MNIVYFCKKKKKGNANKFPKDTFKKSKEKTKF